jgi:hypothetical protein
MASCTSLVIFSQAPPSLPDVLPLPAVIHSYGLLLSLIINASPPLSSTFLAVNPDTPIHEHTSTPFFKLLFLFEALICQPQLLADKLFSQRPTLPQALYGWPYPGIV